MNIEILNTVNLDGTPVTYQSISNSSGGGNSGGGDTPSMPDIPIIGDGKTYLYIHVTSMACSSVTLYLSQTVANGVTIDWGDGSAPETVSSNGKIKPAHGYSQVGKYTISLAPNSDCELGLGHESTSYAIMGPVINEYDLFRNTLRAVEMGDNIAYVTAYAFQKCYLLSDAIIGKNINSIGADAFKECYSLSNVVALNGSIYINHYAFNECKSLKNVISPNGITTASSSAYIFGGCYSLPTIAISNSATGIGNYTFQDCRSLTSITIPDSVTEIGTRAFSGCSSLTSMTIPESVTIMKDYVFGGDSRITKFNINNLTLWCAISLYNTSSHPLYPRGGNLYVNNALVTNLTIPDGVSEIKPYVFCHCTNLSSVTVPDSVTTIGTQAFTNCINLTSVTIGDSVTTIGDNSFSYCYSLSSVTFGNGITSIGSSAFYNCKNVKTYDFSQCTSVPTLSNTNAFYNISNSCRIKVPDTLLDEWKKATNWSTYASRIVAA